MEDTSQGFDKEAWGGANGPAFAGERAATVAATLPKSSVPMVSDGGWWRLWRKAPHVCVCDRRRREMAYSPKAIFAQGRWKIEKERRLRLEDGAQAGAGLKQQLGQAEATVTA